MKVSSDQTDYDAARGPSPAFNTRSLRQDALRLPYAHVGVLRNDVGATLVVAASPRLPQLLGCQNRGNMWGLAIYSGSHKLP